MNIIISFTTFEIMIDINTPNSALIGYFNNYNLDRSFAFYSQNFMTLLKIFLKYLFLVKVNFKHFNFIIELILMQVNQIIFIITNFLHQQQQNL